MDSKISIDGPSLFQDVLTPGSDLKGGGGG